MCYDVIPLVCSDWCILAASFVLAGGGGARMGAGGGEGLNFPQIETSKCERSPAWARLQSSGQHAACLQHRKRAGFNVSVRFDVWKVFTTTALRWWSCWFDGDTLAGKGPALIMYVHSIFFSKFCYISRWRRGGRERRERWEYCVRKTACSSDSRADVLRWTRRGASGILSAGRGSSGALTALSHAALCSMRLAESGRRCRVFQAWNYNFQCLFIGDAWLQTGCELWFHGRNLCLWPSTQLQPPLALFLPEMYFAAIYFIKL